MTIYKGYTIEYHGTNRYYVSMGNRGLMFCRSFEEAQIFIDYLVKKICYT